MLCLLCLHPWGVFAQSSADQERIDLLLRLLSTDEKIAQLNAIDNWHTADNDRLAIPGLSFGDGPHGVGEGDATCFPVGIALAATWDEALLERVGDALGSEFLGSGMNVGLGPCIDLTRDPRNGRTQETAGEDPYLAGKTGAAITRGMQSRGIIACIKHFNLNSVESGRMTNDYTVDERTLVEFYGLAFNMCINEAGALSLMSAYNKINGDYASESRFLLTDILRDLWGYDYVVLSDWGALHDGAKGINAGLDVEEQYFAPIGNKFNSLSRDIHDGRVSMATLDQAVSRVLRAKMASGLMDGGKVADPSDIDSDDHRRLAYEAASQSMVLLKNDGILPLDRAHLGSIAVIGPLADDAQAVLGDQGITASSEVTPSYSVSVLEGIRDRAGSGTTIRYAKGCDVNTSFTHLFSDAITAASLSDVVIYVGGIDHTQEGELQDRKGGSIDIPGKQADLVRELVKVNDQVIVVLIGSGAIGISRFADDIDGVLLAWYPGQEAGNAVADILFGTVNPSGKLPMTLPVNDEQMPVLDFDFSKDIVNGVGYRWYEKNAVTPQFAFGQGLSYTSFSIGDLTLSSYAPAEGETVYATVDVTNTGKRTGAETVQLYVSQTSPMVPMPLKQLKGFQKVTLMPGERRTLTFALGTDAFTHYNPETNTYVADAGTYTLMVGNASDAIVETADIRIKPSRGNAPPMAMIQSENTSGYAPLHAMFDASGSTDRDGRIMSYDWDFGDGHTASGVQAGHEFMGPGMYTVRLTVTDDDGVMDTNTVLVSSSGQNLALNKRAYASSVQLNSGYRPSHAVDGDMGTRWSSAFTNDEWIIVDLGGVYDISKVILTWEKASAKTYVIQLSNDGEHWVDVFSESSGDGGTDILSLSGSGRYVKMKGLKRNIWWGGYSMYEIEVY